MSQHDFDISTADANSGVAVRAAINAALQALASNNSGATAPSTTYAYQMWADTTTGLLKIRNAANSAWITVGTLALAYLGLAALSASNEFNATQHLDGDALLWRFRDTGTSAKEYGIRSDGGNLEICENTGSEGSPTWTVRATIGSTGIVGEAKITLTAAGDLLYASAANVLARLAKGTAYQHLGMNAGATGPEWQASLQSLLTAQGDIPYASAANTPARLAKGTALWGLRMNAGDTAPEWGLDPKVNCRAWVNFNGTGTVAIRAQFNVSSITDNGTGDYTVNFTNAMADADYTVGGGVHYSTSATDGGVVFGCKSPLEAPQSVSSVRVQTSFYGSLYDCNIVSVRIFGN